MRPLWVYLIVVMSWSTDDSYGQLSPGDLSEAHAHLEGMSKCTSCHDLGKKVNSQKCLDCHKEIQSLVQQKRGYHASAEVTSKDCFTCHSEHHGKKFDMTRFDEKKFDHSLTQYTLEGKHAVIECKDCHRPENIASATLRKKGNTFLGLGRECLSCHENYHQGTLSNNCLECHDMKAFKPASKFDHKKTQYKLSGKHVQVDCKECHTIVTKNDRQFQQFSDVPHNDCVACHTDPHNKRFKGKCTQCHTENAFTEFVGKGRFDHSSTAFVLKGKHQSVDCFGCHKNVKVAATAFQFRPMVKESQCASCHADVHQGKMGNKCADCHSETGFKSLISMTTFDHSKADFQLQGKHIGVDCKLCHQGKYTDPINFSACQNCHADYHKGEFAQNGISLDCAGCHSVVEGFGQTMFSIDQHQKSRFPLEGAHLAIPCISCHQQNNQWSFRNIGSDCMDCHKNIHGSQFEIGKVTNCKRCHDSDDWVPKKFNHTLTRFPLEGKHAGLDCKLCHKPIEKEGKIVVVYKIEKFTCADCHPY
jgi:nitrate/TMAO reductase-like tetraheme cytochrome c subunit